MGGMVAQSFVRRYPERVSKLILANTAAPDKAYAERVIKSDKKSRLFPMWLNSRYLQASH
jgi:pimeloyl-ACP methyl ester carboxylesterase